MVEKEPIWDWADCQMVEAVARLGNLTLAARELRVTQPTLSRRLQKLERNFGAALFERARDGMRPTRLAKEWLSEIQAMAEVWARMRRQIHRPLKQQTVRLSIDEVIGHFLSLHLGRIKSGGDINFHLLTGHIPWQIARQEADILIRVCQPQGNDMVVRRIGEIGYALYGAKHYIKSHPAALRETRYKECDWVAFAEDRVWFSRQKAWLDNKLDRNPLLRSNQMTILMDCILGGQCLGLLPCFMADRKAELQRIGPPVVELTETLHVQIHEGAASRKSIRRALDFLISLFREERHSLSGLTDKAVR